MVCWLRLVGVVGVVSWLGCTTADNGTSPKTDNTPPGAGGVFGYTYTRSGDTLTLARQVSSCRNGDLVTRADTERTGMVLAGDSARFTTTDTLSSGAVVCNVRSLVRADTGTGLLGRWEVVRDDNVIVRSDVLPASWITDTILADSMIALHGFFLTIDSTQFLGTFEGSLAALLLPRLFADASGREQITIDTATNGDTVRITGGINGEVVAVTFDRYLNTHVSSSAGRPSYTVWRLPEACNEPTPWFDDFLSVNLPFAEEFVVTQLDTLQSILAATISTSANHDTVLVLGDSTQELITVAIDGFDSLTYTDTRVDRQPQPYRTAWPRVVAPPWWGAFISDNLKP